MKSVKKVLVFFIVLFLSVGCFKVMAVKAEDVPLLTITKTYGDGPFSINFSSTSNGKVTYSSSNKKVVKVSKAGKVTIKGCGKADIKVKVAATGKYKAKTGRITVIVRPKKQIITDLSIDGRNITVKWSKDKLADGYYIYYSTDYKFNNDLHIVKVSKKKTITRTITKLKTGKKYYVKVCSYKKSGKEIILGKFSSVSKVKIK